jgi:hypothetical protein
MISTIAKADWLSAQKCQAMGWYALRAESTLPTEAERFRMEQGQEIGALARQLYPAGVLVSPASGMTAADLTAALMADGSIQILFEAAVVSDPFVAKADIIQRGNAGWHILEVKSSFADTDKLKDLIDDLAYTVMVFRRCGATVTKASLLLLSRGFRFGEGPEHLFEMVEVTNEACARAKEFESNAVSAAATLLSDTRPATALVSACRECAAFAHACIGAGIEHTVLEIPNLHYKKLARLSAAGIVDLSQIPADLGLNERQERARNSALSGTVAVEGELSKALHLIAWPCHYLDFETVATVLPLYPDHGCHDQVLTQFSIHHRDNMGGQLWHSEYLADPSKDCQRELAETLISALGQGGSIVVYTSFEKQRIEALMRAFPDLAGSLQAIISRLVDLHPFIADHVYHPDFRGSFSIKKVLPALVPDLSYQELVIRDGDTAITRFARMARGEIPAKEVSLTRQELLHYCAVDTLAMVKLHDALHGMASV